MAELDYIELQDYANSLRTGFLKTWKANSICGTIGLIQEMKIDPQRLYNFLSKALEMEGFDQQDIVLIQKYISEKFNNV